MTPYKCSMKATRNPYFAIRLNGQEFRADGRPFGGLWITQISDKKCSGCLIAKPNTNLYMSAEEPTVIHLEIQK